MNIQKRKKKKETGKKRGKKKKRGEQKIIIRLMGDSNDIPTLESRETRDWRSSPDHSRTRVVAARNAQMVCNPGKRRG